MTSFYAIVFWYLVCRSYCRSRCPSGCSVIQMLFVLEYSRYDDPAPSPTPALFIFTFGSKRHWIVNVVERIDLYLRWAIQLCGNSSRYHVDINVGNNYNVLRDLSPYFKGHHEIWGWTLGSVENLEDFYTCICYLVILKITHLLRIWPSFIYLFLNLPCKSAIDWKHGNVDNESFIS